jgi:glutamate synthase domain-containing protein 3
MVETLFLALAEDLRQELAAVGARTVGEVVGESRRALRPTRAAAPELAGVVAAGRWPADGARRADPAMPARTVRHAPASPLEVRIAAAFRDQGPVAASGLRLSTADRSFGAGLTGATERGELHGPVRLEVRGSAGQSFGAFASPSIDLTLVGQANDYVAKGLSGGRVVVRPEPELPVAAAGEAIAGNTVLYGATGGRLHLVGRAGMRFAVRNSGACAVVEGIGAHGCEYMTGGVVVVVGPIGANFGAGMTGGRAYLYDPSGRHAAALHGESVAAIRLSEVLRARPDGPDRFGELLALLQDHAGVGSSLAARLVLSESLAADTWLVDPVAPSDAVATTGPEPVGAIQETTDEAVRSRT